jgi:hypothetical protein
MPRQARTYLPNLHCTIASSYTVDKTSLLTPGASIVNLIRWKPLSSRICYIGIEIEFNLHPDVPILETRQKIYEHFECYNIPVILKYDGSLDYSRGVELNTIPFVVEGVWEAFRDFYAAFGNKIVVSTNTGLHAHVSRDALSLLVQRKLGYFIYNNKEFCCMISARDSRWATYLDNFQLPLSKSIMGEGSAVRNNNGTWELRIFKSPASFLEFQIRIGFVKELILFLHSTSYAALDVPSFYRYLKSHKNKYNIELIRYIESIPRIRQLACVDSVGVEMV